jgi:phosphatidylserine/phosphatidylglycerophosphate/cardiolipin synthase-like enzyme
VNKAIVGPVLSDLSGLWQGSEFVLASAFYSASRLRSTTITTQSAELLVRLDLTSPDEWITRAVAPDALLELLERHSNVDIRVYCGPRAHAKVYLGDDAFVTGSANYTVRGLAGTAAEVVWYESSRAAVRAMRRALAEYRRSLTPLTRSELEKYVERYRDIVKKRQGAAVRSLEDILPTDTERPRRTGSYESFLKWLERRDGAADEVLARAHGKGNLSGHIRMNFFGIRQFLLAHPKHGQLLRRADAQTYRLSDDSALQQDLKAFVDGEAADEGGLIVDTWRTYLPAHSGGKPKSGGGTQGNLNRMLPLMAQFLKSVC